MSGINDILFKGAELHFKGELDEAVKTFREALKIDQNNAYAKNQIGWIYVKKNKFDEALKEFEQVRDKHSDNTFCRKWLGLLYMHFEKMQKAQEMFQEASALDPANADIYYFQGALYNILHAPDKALEMLRKSKEADLKVEADTYFRLADAFHSLNLIYSAELEYKNTLELNPKHTKALNELGWIYFDKEQYDLASEKWKESYKINAKDNETRFNLAHLHNFLARRHLKDGNIKRAIAEWKEAIKYFDRNYEANYYIKKYEKGV